MKQDAALATVRQRPHPPTPPTSKPHANGASRDPISQLLCDRRSLTCSAMFEFSKSVMEMTTFEIGQSESLRIGHQVEIRNETKVALVFGYELLAKDQCRRGDECVRDLEAMAEGVFGYESLGGIRYLRGDW